MRFAPGETKRGVFAAREDGRVLNGDAALIVITIQRPGLKLAARELAFMHEQVEMDACGDSALRQWSESRR